MASSDPSQNDPEKLVKLAQEAYREKRYQQAGTLFSSAAAAFAENGDQEMSAEMSSNASVAYMQAGDPTRALGAIRDVPSFFAGTGNKTKHGVALGNYASALEAEGQVDEAFNKYTEAAELLESAGESDLLSHVLRSLAHLETRRGNRIQAAFYYRRYLLLAENLSLREKILKQFFKLFL